MSLPALSPRHWSSHIFAVDPANGTNLSLHSCCSPLHVGDRVLRSAQLRAFRLLCRASLGRCTARASRNRLSSLSSVCRASNALISSNSSNSFVPTSRVFGPRRWRVTARSTSSWAAIAEVVCRSPISLRQSAMRLSATLIEITVPCEAPSVPRPRPPVSA